jgi:hypothetical protein
MYFFASKVKIFNFLAVIPLITLELSNAAPVNPLAGLDVVGVTKKSMSLSFALS